MIADTERQHLARCLQFVECCSDLQRFNKRIRSMQQQDVEEIIER